ncbi:hypothetical protein [Streptomyces silvisoli]|uniref:DUF397 domain-containing protein n=1 Tax=Streptomyces silvisoli TaxID=3034235 RepID=A0ABT5ZG33_9ACTN|nr:hypothetical protein [Streptomyces silvisoli]MDF3288782.1 hypothetical protein [Streptomyces silvisoli]
MEWTTTSDVKAFDAAAGDFPRSRPAQHTAQLTVCARPRQRGPRVVDDGDPEFGRRTGTVARSERPLPAGRVGAVRSGDFSEGRFEP